MMAVESSDRDTKGHYQICAKGAVFGVVSYMQYCSRLLGRVRELQVSSLLGGRRNALPHSRMGVQCASALLRRMTREAEISQCWYEARTARCSQLKVFASRQCLKKTPVEGSRQLWRYRVHCIARVPADGVAGVFLGSKATASSSTEPCLRRSVLTCLL